MQVIFGALLVVGLLASPIILIWGWTRSPKLPKPRTVSSVFSLIGFLCSTASGLLAVSAIVFSLLIRGFPYYDPLLLRIFRWGFLLSFGGIVFGISGIGRPSSLRWHAPVSGFTMLVFWFMAATGE
jgi:hypothetical protein